MIYLDDPNIDESDLKYVNKAILDGDISTRGNYIKQFENAISNYLGGPHCIATNTGSASLLVALKILGIGMGDEVIVPACTFAATVNAIKMVGAKPVFVDIDQETWNIDLKQIYKIITERTRVIVPVHLYGNPCDMDEIKYQAKHVLHIYFNSPYLVKNKQKIFIVEDACESFGATCDTYYTGVIGDIGCFSFNRNKTITTGGGGMIVTKNPDLAKQARQFINQGRDENGKAVGPGFNFRMVNQNAALGLSQLKQLKEFLDKKSYFAYQYWTLLSDCKNIKFQLMKDGRDRHSYWFTAIKINTQKVGKTIPQIQEELQAKGIPTRRIFEPLAQLPNAIDFYENGLCLPSSTKNTYEDIEYIAKTLLEVLN